jgi:hypothetical protein
MEKQRTLAIGRKPLYAGSMPYDRDSLKALRNLISETDLILETTPDLPQNRTACSRENLRAALALVDDLIGQQRMSAAAVMGHKGGSSLAATRGPDYFRKLAAKRTNRRGGRPRKRAE